MRGLSGVIPQLFYDLIARVLPCDRSSSDLKPAQNEEKKAALALCYTAGVILGISRVQRDRVQSRYCGARWDSTYRTSRSHTRKHDRDFRELYQWVRLENPDAGSRLVKLRAEAKMAGTTGIAALLSALLGIALHYHPHTTTPPPLTQATLILTPTLISLLFLIHERQTWHIYYDNVITVYTVLQRGHGSGAPPA